MKEGVFVVKETITKLKNLAKEHFCILALLVLALFFFHSIISPTKVMKNIHYINDVTFYSSNMKEALKQGALPLWTPYYYSGRPLFAQPEYYFIDFNFLLILLTGNIILAMNLSAIIHIFLAGLGMYFLALFFINSKKAAFISALIYMFNGFVHTFVVPGNIMVIEGYSLIPFIFLFTAKALRSKDLVFNSVIAGIFAALLIFAGGVIFVPYLLLLTAIYSIIYIIDKNALNRILKLIIAGILISAIALGVSAIKLLPGIEFIKLSNRGTGIPYQEYLGEPIKPDNFGFAFISNVFLKGEHISAAIGIAGFLLLIFGISRFKNKTALFSGIVILLSLLLSHETFLTKLFFNIPVFNQVRHVERSIFMFAFAASILAGFGFIKIESLADKFKKFNKNALFSIIIALLLLELFMLQPFPQSGDVWKAGDIPILDYIGKEQSKFRVINLALNDLIGASGYNYYSQLGIGDLKGGSGIWFNDYISFLAIAQYSPAKLWGILNAKYAIHSQNVSIEGLRLVGRFGECAENCEVGNAFGPFLYKNEKFLPRYYIAPNSALVVGDAPQAKQLVYSLIVQGSEPKNIVFVQGAEISGYGMDFLTKFNYIFFASGEVDQSNTDKLMAYKSQGGIIIPDILNGKNSITNEDVDLINSAKGALKEIKIGEFSHNKVALELNGEKGWLVASERFAYFPGWTASINDNKVEIFGADNAVSAVYLNGKKGKLVFEYKPDSYKKGRLISILALIALIAYFAYFIYKQFKLGGSNQA